MSKFKHRHWGDQFDGIAHEISKLAIACDIEVFKPGTAERILHNDESVCGKKNPAAFRKIRTHLMALFPLEESAIRRLGPDDTLEILDGVRAAIKRLRDSGSDSDPGAN